MPLCFHEGTKQLSADGFDILTFVDSHCVDVFVSSGVWKHDPVGYKMWFSTLTELFAFVCNSFFLTIQLLNRRRTQVSHLSQLLRLSPPAPPMIRLSVNDTVVVDPGQDLQLSCDITAGFPAPTVTWVRYPGPLPLSAQVRGPTLILRAVTPADAGFYNCTAVNNVGNPARKNVNVIVRSKLESIYFQK